MLLRLCIKARLRKINSEKKKIKKGTVEFSDSEVRTDRVIRAKSRSTPFRKTLNSRSN